jgi:hypothetical protein
MATVNEPSAPPVMYIAIIFGGLSSIMSFAVFILCRFDHDLKLLSLGNVMGQVTALMATASTMLVGRDFSSAHTDLPTLDVPAGSFVTQTNTTGVQTPPAPPEV